MRITLHDMSRLQCSDLIFQEDFIHGALAQLKAERDETRRQLEEEHRLHMAARQQAAVAVRLEQQHHSHSAAHNHEHSSSQDGDCEHTHEHSGQRKKLTKKRI